MSLAAKFKQSLLYIISNPITRYTTLGNMFRFFGMFASDYFMPAFFLKNYSSYTSEFGLAIPLIVLFGGMTSSFLGGREAHPALLIR